MARVKFNDEICNCLIENYSSGIPLKYCADVAGISRATIYNWMDKGKKAKSGKYHQFYQQMQRAKALFIQKNLQDIQDSKSWMAKQYLLQVTDPEQFVVAEKQEMETTVRADITADVDMTDKEIHEKDLELLKSLLSDKDDRTDSGASEPTAE